MAPRRAHVRWSDICIRRHSNCILIEDKVLRCRCRVPSVSRHRAVTVHGGVRTRTSIGSCCSCMATMVWFYPAVFRLSTTVLRSDIRFKISFHGIPIQHIRNMAMTRILWNQLKLCTDIYVNRAIQSLWAFSLNHWKLNIQYSVQFWGLEILKIISFQGCWENTNERRLLSGCCLRLSVAMIIGVSVAMIIMCVIQQCKMH
jgi:hypothetical protein